MCQKEDRMHVARIMANAGHKQKYIAAQLGVSDRMVRKYLDKDFGTRPRKKRESILKPYYPIIEETLEENPYSNLVYLYERLQKSGYSGGITILRDYARCIRRKLVSRAILRFETEPGRQAQVDWKECGKWEIDGKEQKLYAFVLLLGYSRKPFVLFTLDMTLPTLLMAHLMAFEYFGSIPLEILYDNMKTAWINKGGVWNVNSNLLALASASGFSPKRCQVRRPQTKGKVERFIGYLAHNFLPRDIAQNAGTLDDLNSAVNLWLTDIDDKQISGIRKTRRERFEEEKIHMLPWVPEAAPDVRLEKELMVSREGTIRFQTNSYGLHADYIGQMVTLKVNTITQEAQVLHDEMCIRSFTLLPKGSHETDIREDERLSLQKRWEKENRRLKATSDRKRKPDPGNQDWIQKALDIEVDVRHPESFDLLQVASL
jgi:transposase